MHNKLAISAKFARISYYNAHYENDPTYFL